MMNTKKLLLLTALMCVAPNVAPSPLIPEASCNSCSCCCGASSAQDAIANPANPDLDPSAFYFLGPDPEGIAVLEQMLDQNPNAQLQAGAADKLGRILLRNVELSDDPFAQKLGTIRDARQYFMQARDLYAAMEQTDEIQRSIESTDGQISRFYYLGARTVADFQALIDMVTELGVEVSLTAQELYEKRQS